MRIIFAAFAVFLAISALLPGCVQPHPQGSATVTFNTSYGIARVDAEVVGNDISRSRGLMFRTSLEDGKGMLFVFDSPAVQGFWMKNTLIPLDLIYIYPNQTVGKIRHEFQPCKSAECESDLSPPGILYVLEVPGGWAKTHGVVNGTYAKIS